MVNERFLQIEGVDGNLLETELYIWVQHKEEPVRNILVTNKVTEELARVKADLFELNCLEGNLENEINDLVGKVKETDSIVRFYRILYQNHFQLRNF